MASVAAGACARAVTPVTPVTPFTAFTAVAAVTAVTAFTAAASDAAAAAATTIAFNSGTHARAHGEAAAAAIGSVADPTVSIGLGHVTISACGWIRATGRRNSVPA